jgi:hypothetical protein
MKVAPNRAIAYGRVPASSNCVECFLSAIDHRYNHTESTAIKCALDMVMPIGRNPHQRNTTRIGNSAK